MGFFFWKKKQEPQNTESEISRTPSGSSPSTENKDRNTLKAEKYFNKGLEFLNSSSYKDRALQQFINSGNLGYIDAIHYIGLCYFKGYGTPSDQKRAVEIWKKNVLKENPLTQYMLGYCYFHGLGVSKDRIVARKYLKEAAALGNTDATKLLTEFTYTPSQTSQPNPPKETELPTEYPEYQNVTDEYTRAVFFLVESLIVDNPIKEKYFQSGREILIRLVSGGNSGAKDLIAYFPLLEKQLFIYSKQDVQTARNLLSSLSPESRYQIFFAGANCGSSRAKVELGKCYRDGIGVKADKSKAEFWLSAAAKSGNKEAKSLLDAALISRPLAYQTPSSQKNTKPSQDAQKIARSFESSSVSSFPETRFRDPEEDYREGLFYYVGEKTGRKNRTKAYEYFSIAKKHCSKSAQFLLNTESQELYIFLEAAKYGSKKAKKQVIDWEENGYFTGKIPEGKLTQYFKDLNVPSILLLSPEELYQEGLAYYVGDRTGREHINKAVECFNIARRRGLKDAEQLLESKYIREYAYLEAAKYGSERAKRTVIEYDDSGMFEGKIPHEEQIQYFKDIGVKPSFSRTPDEQYRCGLAYYVGDKTGHEEIAEGFKLLQIASELGSEEAKFLLDSGNTYYYAYLEAAKAGSSRAKQQIIEWDDSGVLVENIPYEQIVKYFTEIGVVSLSFGTADELYKLGLEYYVGERAGSENIRKATACFKYAKERGSEEATWILETPHTHEYVYLEAAKHGNIRAKKQISKYDSEGKFDGKIPPSQLLQYFSEIGLSSVLQQTPDEHYKLGLFYYVGEETGRKNPTKANEHFNIAIRYGSEDARRLLTIRYMDHFVYLEAAKHGSTKAKEEVRKRYEAGDFSRRIPKHILDSYLREIGPLTKPAPTQNTKSSSVVTPSQVRKTPGKSEKIVLDKELIQEVKADHLYVQNRLAIDYGSEEFAENPSLVPTKPETSVDTEVADEWEQMRNSLSETHIQILSVLLNDPGNITIQKDIAKANGNMLDILYDEINEIADEILGDLLISDGEITEEYLDDVKSLCV